MEALRADWRESLARFEAEGAEARAEAAKERAEDRAAAARERAEDRENIANLRAEMEKNTKWQTAFIVAGIAVATGFLGLWAQILLRSGG